MRNHHGVELTGYPFSEEAPGLRYKRGSEAEVGDYKPTGLKGVGALILERARAAMSVNPTSDSPIESILGAAIILCFQKRGKPLVLASEPSPKAGGLLLIPQFRWGIYRSDWAIYNPKTTGALLIECDGKEFHSSADQIAHDTKKDQAAHDMGFLTMRFSGSSIHHDADGCAKEIFGFVYGGSRGSD